MAVYLQQTSDQSGTKAVNGGYGFGRWQYTGGTTTLSVMYLAFKNATNNTSETFRLNLRQYNTEGEGGAGTLLANWDSGNMNNPAGGNTNTLSRFYWSANLTLTNGKWYQLDIWVADGSGGTVYTASDTSKLAFALADSESDAFGAFVTTYYTTLSVTASGAVSLAGRRIVQLILNAVALADVALNKGFVIGKTLASTATAVASMSLVKTYVRVLSATATASVAITKKISKTLSVTATAVVTMSRAFLYNIVLNATATAAVSLGKIAIHCITLSVTAVAKVKMWANGLLVSLFRDKYEKHGTNWEDKYPTQ